MAVRRTPEGGLVKTIWDLSEEARLAEELREARATADAANAAKSEFLSSTSHELRTPLNSILGFSRLLQRDKTNPLAARHRDWVAQIAKGGEHLLRLIDEILMNFGSNAVKYNHQNGCVKFAVSLVGSGRVRIAVADTGMGIPTDKQHAVFQPFQREARTCCQPRNATHIAPFMALGIEGKSGRGFIPATLLSVLFALSCVGNTPRLAARKTGELTQPLAERTEPDKRFLANCGEGGPIQGSVALDRTPYLQDVTETGAVVAFSTTSNDPVVVDITTPESEAISSTSAGLDAAAGRDGRATLAANVSGLSPATDYCYALRGITERAGFTTAPSAESAAPVRFIAFGDSGDGSSYQYAVMTQMESVAFDLVLHLGDVAYDSGSPGELEAEYFQVYAPILRSFPAYVVAGNHDYSTDDAAPLRQALVLPTNGGELGRERWYSFDRGSVHFVGLDTERMSADQAAWLERDLTANRQPWTVVFGHRPAFSSGEHGGDAAYRKYVVPILTAHRVDLVLSGHEHDYERFKPIDGVVYVVSGGGGRGTRAVGAGPSTAFSEDVLHFVYVDVSDNVLTLHAIDGVGREFDQAVIRHSS